jgi:hypothetical protein
MNTSLASRNDRNGVNPRSNYQIRPAGPRRAFLVGLSRGRTIVDVRITCARAALSQLAGATPASWRGTKKVAPTLHESTS